MSLNTQNVTIFIFKKNVHVFCFLTKNLYFYTSRDCHINFNVIPPRYPKENGRDRQTEKQTDGLQNDRNNMRIPTNATLKMNVYNFFNVSFLWLYKAPYVHCLLICITFRKNFCFVATR